MLRIFNLKKDKEDSRDFKFKAVHPAEKLPKVVDNRLWFSEVRDQADLGSCSAFSSVGGAYEMLENKQLIQKLPLDQSPEEFGPVFKQASTLFQYQNTLILEDKFGQDDGATMRDAVKAMATYGVCPEEAWPYDISKFGVKPPQEAYDIAIKHKISMYASIGTNIGIDQALAQHLPVVLGIAIYESFQAKKNIKSGMPPMPKFGKEELLGWHAVCLAGYTEKHYIMRNSWGKSCGIDGYFLLPRKYINLQDQRLTMDAWVITK